MPNVLKTRSSGFPQPTGARVHQRYLICVFLTSSHHIWQALQESRVLEESRMVSRELAVPGTRAHTYSAALPESHELSLLTIPGTSMYCSARYQ